MYWHVWLRRGREHENNCGADNSGKWNLPIFSPKTPAKTDDFAEYVQIFTFLLKLLLKLSISWSFLSDGSGRVGRVGGFGIPKKCENNTRIYHFYTQFEAPILVTVNFEWESLASVVTNITKNETKRRKQIKQDAKQNKTNWKQNKTK